MSKAEKMFELGFTIDYGAVKDYEATLDTKTFVEKMFNELGFTIDYSEEPYYDYLPTKVVFNEKLKRTTLVFRNPNEQFDVVRSEAKDEYNEYLGFLVAMVKYLYKEQAKRHINYGYKRYNKFKNNIQNYLEQLIRQDIKLSDYQLEKLFDNITKKDKLKFNIDGNIHEIEIERK